MLDTILIDLQQYKVLCRACDKILDDASDNDEVVSIPMLHVLREHPECLKFYNFIFSKKRNIKSRSLDFHPAISNAFFDDGIGPVPITEGSTPHDAQDLISAKGFIPLFSASFFDIRTTAAAPSLIPEALPAVTVPSFCFAVL